MLGRQLKLLLRTGDEATAVALLADVVLLARARSAARGAGRRLADVIAEACREFADHGSEDDWATCMSALRTGGDPGAAFVAAALRRHLDGCGCGGRMR